MGRVKLPTDRTIYSTENNEYAEGLRDENMLEEEMADTEIPFTDEIPDVVNETGVRDREYYDEEGIC